MGLAKIDQKLEITRNQLSLLYCTYRKRFSLKSCYISAVGRGRENLRSSKKDSFKVSEYTDGRKYIVAKDELTKKHCVDDECHEGGIILASFLLYLSKLINPKLNFFFKRPKAVMNSYGPWYVNPGVGCETFGTINEKN